MRPDHTECRQQRLQERLSRTKSNTCSGSTSSNMSWLARQRIRGRSVYHFVCRSLTASSTLISSFLLTAHLQIMLSRTAIMAQLVVASAQSSISTFLNQTQASSAHCRSCCRTGLSCRPRRSGSVALATSSSQSSLEVHQKACPTRLHQRSIPTTAPRNWLQARQSQSQHSIVHQTAGLALSCLLLTILASVISKTTILVLSGCTSHLNDRPGCVQACNR